ncbi:hypothetical protein MN116_003296 [Schistosoma mekongi]|uniref:Large ribosomal subunit protein uL11m n=1 Tax=Schistosoma mekongi TaxID=38744 RepID=A0AAE1ZIL5_SCHME|nr:hypothetical protein MN116_003296 [Schistosoma mekongi]
MASRAAAKVVRKTKVSADPIVHSPFLKIIIPAQQARPAPPLGPQLGRRNVNIANFCKDFNERTKDVIEGTPMPCFISVKADRSYDLVISHPSSMHLLRMAAAAEKGAASPGTEVCGRLTLKHIYHIAELKKQDPHLLREDLQAICKMLIGTAHRLGIEVVTQDDIKSGRVDYTPSGYAKFLQNREQYLKQKKLENETAKQSKMMRL